MPSKSNWLEYWVDPQTWAFRGDFEGMYRDFDDPWECQKNVSELRRDISLMMLFRNRRFGRILDIGCGLGAFTDRIRITNGAEVEIVGVDVASTAIHKAREQFPRCRFEILDVALEPLPRAEGQWDLVLASELIWYVLPQLPGLVDRLHTCLAPNGILFIQQFFPINQRFGLEYLRSPAELYSRYLLPAGFSREHELIESVADGQVLLVTLTKTEKD